jgi:amino acid permease
MWPILFGSGWLWSALVAAALVCFIVGVLGFLFLITVKPPRQTSDEFEEVWHRYEEGDLTRSEFERTIRGRALGN